MADEQSLVMPLPDHRRGRVEHKRATVLDSTHQRRCRRPWPGDTWHMDKVFPTIHRGRHDRWRTVDEDGHVLEIPVSHRRDQKAAKPFFWTLLRGLTDRPRVVITDQLTRDGDATREGFPRVEPQYDRSLNHRAE